MDEAQRFTINRKFIIIISLVILVISLPVTIFLVKHQQDIRSRAASADQLEAESGVLSSGAVIKPDSQASGGQYVLFEQQEVVSDSFTRTLTSSWGSAEIGGAYSLFSSTADYNVTKDTGTMKINAAGGTRRATLDTVSKQDVEITVKVSTDKLATGTTGSTFYLIGRKNASGDYYAAKIRFTSSQTVSIDGIKNVGGVETSIGGNVTVSGLTHTAGTFYFAKAEISGTNPTTIQARVWQAGNVQPASWQYSSTDSSATSLQTSGAVGLSATIGSTSTNAPILFSFDDYSVIDLSVVTATPTPIKTASSNSFVKRVNDDFYIDGVKTRFVGANVYWLGLLESGGVRYPTHFEIEDALETVAEMGGNAVRSFGAGTMGCSLCIEPTLNNFNPNAFDSMDYAIKIAKDNNIRLVLALVDQNNYYHGGKYTFLKWRNDPDCVTYGDADCDHNGHFFTDPTIISDFKNYISYVLNHTNQYTGVKYKDDPTIMVWETGNEVYPGKTWNSTTIAPWTKEIGEYIKSIAPNQLVADGHYGFDSGSYTTAVVDIMSDHYSKPNSKVVTNSDVAISKGKGNMLGEMNWTGTRIDNGDLQVFVDLVEANDVDFYMYWSLFPHRDDPNASSKGYVQHGDGYTLHYPGDNADMLARAQILRTNAFKVGQGQSPAPAHKTPEAPLMLTPSLSSGNIVVKWRGIVGGATYSLERSVDQTNWTVVSSTVTDNNDPYTDTGAPAGKSYYRIAGKNLDGVKGPYSNVVNITK